MTVTGTLIDRLDALSRTPSLRLIDHVPAVGKLVRLREWLAVMQRSGFQVISQVLTIALELRSAAGNVIGLTRGSVFGIRSGWASSSTRSSAVGMPHGC